KVVNIVSNGALSWPISWYNLFPILNQVNVPVLGDVQEDILLWRNHDGVMHDFSVRKVWNIICERGEEIERLRQWDVGNDVDLTMLRRPLCKTQPDTHEHLFFECSYSIKIWTRVLKAADLLNIFPIWDDIMDWMIPRNNRIHGKGDRNQDNVTSSVIDTTRLKLASIRFKKNARVDRMKSI
ncbi:hypothetical protein Tco_1416184, partial [Tanacetum coccineum]